MTTATLSNLLVPLTYDAILVAAETVRRHLPATPSLRHPLLDRQIGSSVVVKHENVLPTGSFKVRGGVHLASLLTPAEVRGGLITASTGNHAQSVAFAGRLAGSAVTVVVPTSTPLLKREAVEALGARVVAQGPTLAEAAAYARCLQAGSSMRYVEPAEAAIVLGHATAYVELFTAHRDLEAVYVPVGSGTGAAGACLVRDVLAPGCRVVGVQSEAAPAAWRSWRAGRAVTAPCTTRVGGLATATGYPLTLSVLQPRLDEFLLIGDDAIDEAAALLMSRAHTLAEGAGAASLAGLLADPARPERSAVVCTGGNASPEEITRIARLIGA